MQYLHITLQHSQDRMLNYFLRLAGAAAAKVLQKAICMTDYLYTMAIVAIVFELVTGDPQYSDGNNRHC